MLKRELLRSLKWGNNNFFIPVFTKKEIELEPTRWLKNLLLEHIGLRSITELNTDIQRYRDIDSAQKACQSILNGLLEPDIDLIIKLVPFDQINSLSNYHIYNVKEINSVFDKLTKDPTRYRTVEIWICWLHKKRDNVSGRLSFSIGKISAVNFLEMVWTIPRQIETLKHNKTEFPFLRASKSIGSFSYSIDQIFIPNNSTLTQKNIISEYEQIMRSVYLHQEYIDTLGSILNNAGVNELCLEFVVLSGKLKFIDWDI